MFTLTTRTGALSLPGDTRVYPLGRHSGGDVPSLPLINAPRFTAPYVRRVQLAPRVLPVKAAALPQLSTRDRDRWTYTDALAVLAWQETNARTGDASGSVADVVGGLVRVIFDHTAEVSDDCVNWRTERAHGGVCKAGASRLDGLHSPRAAAVGDVVLLPVAGAWTLAAVTGLA